MHQLSLPPEPSKKILDNITRYYPKSTVFVFGYQQANEHFHLAVFTSDTIKQKDVDLANLLTGQNINASVLVHRVTDLATRQPHQQVFFDNLLRTGYRLCIDKANPPYLLNTPDLEKADENNRKFWLKCVAVAQFNIDAARQSQHEDVVLCKIALLHTGCVQIALGLIRVHLSYSPNEFGLNYLLALCGHFTDLPSNLFNQDLPETEKRYKMLCAPPSMLQYWTELHANEMDFLWLLDACEQFLIEAKQLAAQKIDIIPTTKKLKP